MRAADGRGPPTLLLDLCLELWERPDADGLISAIYYDATPRTQVARAAELVFSAAQAGDGVALRLIATAGEELALAIRACAARLHLAAPLPLALGGSLLLRQAILRESLLTHLHTDYDAVHLALVDDPALSAARASRPDRA